MNLRYSSVVVKASRRTSGGIAGCLFAIVLGVTPAIGANEPDVIARRKAEFKARAESNMKQGRELMIQEKYEIAFPVLCSVVGYLDRETDPVAWADAVVISLECLERMSSPNIESAKLQDAVRIYTEHFGQEDARLSLPLKQLGVVEANEYNRKGDFKKAAAYLDRALKIEEKQHGLDCGHIAGILRAEMDVMRREMIQERMPWEQWKQQQDGPVRQVLQRLLRLDEENYQQEKPATKFVGAKLRSTLEQLAELVSQAGRPHEAEPYLRRSLAIAEEMAGTESAELKPILEKVADYHRNAGHFDDAAACYLRLLKIHDAAPEKSEIHLGNLLGALSNALRDAGRRAEEEPYRRRLLIWEVQLLGLQESYCPIFNASRISPFLEPFAREFIRMVATPFLSSGQMEEYARLLTALKLDESAIQARITLLIWGDDPGPLSMKWRLPSRSNPSAP